MRPVEKQPQENRVAKENLVANVDTNLNVEYVTRLTLLTGGGTVEVRCQEFTNWVPLRRSQPITQMMTRPHIRSNATELVELAYDIRYGLLPEVLGEVSLSDATVATQRQIILNAQARTDLVTALNGAGLVTSVVDGQVTVGVASTAILAADATRRNAQIKNNSTTDTCYISQGAATINAYPLGPGASIAWPEGLACFGICDAGKSADIRTLSGVRA